MAGFLRGLCCCRRETVKDQPVQGWAGSELARSIAKEPDLSLVAAVSRRHAGSTLGDVLAEPKLTAPIFFSAAEALSRPCQVFVEYTKPEGAKSNILAAIDRGAMWSPEPQALPRTITGKLFQHGLSSVARSLRRHFMTT
jgi:hypothetical protein